MQPTERVPNAETRDTTGSELDTAAYPAGDHPAPDAYEEEESHVHLPPQSMWPITVAGGVAIAAAGLVTTPVISILGILLLCYGLIMWVQELRHELH